MAPHDPRTRDDLTGDGGAEDDLWFLPGPMDAGDGDPPPGPTEAQMLADWVRAEAGMAARLARVAGRLGALDERLRRGPAGWRHRLALIEAAELGWWAGDRITPDRLALWVALRLAGAQADAEGLARGAWAVRRLAGGPGPEEAGLPAFLGRHDTDAAAEPLADRTGAWAAMMADAQVLHPVSRAALGYHLWAGAGMPGDRLEAAVTAARIAAAEGQGAVFLPLAMGGADPLRPGGTPAARLGRWLDGADAALRRAQRLLDDIEGWDARAARAMAALSGRTPPALRVVLAEWPLVSAPMAEVLTGASRAAVQRNLAWMQERGLIREVTGQGRFRMWRASS